MLDWVIVGGGPHGVHLAIRLIGEAGVDPATIRIVDPAPRLLDTWQRCTANTGMTHLRSPAVHHLDLDPFSLLRFAADEAGRRGGAKGMFVGRYNQPSLGLFTSHCDMLLERYGLEGLHLRHRASRLALDCDRVQVALQSGDSLETRRVLLAIGASEQPRWPSWSTGLPEGAVRHVFEAGFELDPDAWPERIAVLGAGITGAQVALRLAEAGREVVLVTRHPLREHAFDSDPGWVGPKSMRRFSKTRDPEARRRMITGARHVGSVPPAIHRRLRKAVSDGRVQLVRGEVRGATASVGVQLDVAGRAVGVDAVLLATGFESGRPGGTLVDPLVESEALPCGTCGFPLVDRHLRWHPRIFVTGPLAELEIGPVARNLVGARRAAERIIPVAAAPP